MVKSMNRAQGESSRRVNDTVLHWYALSRSIVSYVDRVLGRVSHVNAGVSFGNVGRARAVGR